MSNKRDSLSINLDPEDRDRLEFIKTHYSLRRDAEAVRLAINDSYKIAKKRTKQISPSIDTI